MASAQFLREVNVADINTTLNACELVWRQQSIAAATIAEMRAELESHLREAVSAGKSPDAVVGQDIKAFARSWAGVGAERGLPATDTRLHAERLEKADQARTRLLISIAAIVAVTLFALILGPRGQAADLEVWQWIFVGSAFFLLVGELMTGSFFVLPFAVAASASALLAFANVEPAVLLTVFVIISLLGLWGLREWARKDDDVVIPVGANRYVGQVAVVTEAISGIGTVGRVRIETENWMAITDNNEHITEGAVVHVVEVRGARLVVRAN